MRRGLRWAALASVVALAVGGCAGEAEQIRRLSSPVPQYRFDAAIWLAGHGSEASLPALIDGLEDRDPSVRWAVVQALRERTGERFGYQPGDPEPRRLEAVERWRNWWQGRQGGGPEAPGGDERGPGSEKTVADVGEAPQQGEVPEEGTSSE